jgi:hypothetical protein
MKVCLFSSSGFLEPLLLCRLTLIIPGRRRCTDEQKRSKMPGFPVKTFKIVKTVIIGFPHDNQAKTI